MAIRPELRAELLALSVEERGELADELYESLPDEPPEPPEPPEPGWAEAWSDELARRLADVAGGRVELVDADEVHAELRAELRDPAR